MYRPARPLAAGCLAAALALAGCVPFAVQGTGGSLAMQVVWPMRVQAIPESTEVLAVGVFRDGQIVSRNSQPLTLVSRRSGAIVYTGLADGAYRVVAGAYDAHGNLLSGGSADAVIDFVRIPRTRVAVQLSPGHSASELAPFASLIRQHLGDRPSVLPTPTAPPASAAPPASPPQNDTGSSPPASDTPSTAPTPASGSGSGSTSPVVYPPLPQMTGTAL